MCVCNIYIYTCTRRILLSKYAYAPLVQRYQYAGPRLLTYFAPLKNRIYAGIYMQVYAEQGINAITVPKKHHSRAEEPREYPPNLKITFSQRKYDQKGRVYSYSFLNIIKRQ